MNQTALPFAHVVYDSGHETTQLSADQYGRLPLSERIRCVLEKRARFIDGRGQEVDSRSALAWLRERQAAPRL